MIDLDTWCFETESFSSAVEFCEHISANGREYQHCLQKKIMALPVYKNWKASSPPIKDMPFYGLYRKSSQSKKFHASAQAIAFGTGTDNDHKLLEGLKREIINSPIALKPGKNCFMAVILILAARLFHHLIQFLRFSLAHSVQRWQHGMQYRKQDNTRKLHMQSFLSLRWPQPVRPSLAPEAILFKSKSFYSLRLRL